AVGMQPADADARLAAQDMEITANDNFAVRQHCHAVDRFVSAGVKSAVESPIVLQPDDPCTWFAAPAQKRSRNNDFAVVQDGHLERGSAAVSLETFVEAAIDIKPC